jgi:hypothetical protein
MSLLLIAAAPFWLPAVVVAVRIWIFTRINGEEGIQIPSERFDATRFKRLYGDPAARGRSKGAALSDLFWYWLAPGPEVHQEHIEPGSRYDEVAAVTARILAVPRDRAEATVRECVHRVLAERDAGNGRLVRLRDLLMPVWAEFYYELVFGEPCPRSVRDLIVGNATDVATALKCTGLRHMGVRNRLTSFLAENVRAGRVRHALPSCLSHDEQAFYLQGTFFNTAIVQSSEAMAHLFMAIAQHPGVQDRLVFHPDDDGYLDRVISETFRLYPLFGVSHRITSADITLDDETTIPRGSVLCFNHAEYHRAGYAESERFDPDRWLTVAPAQANFIPFGVAGNRPCPAQRLALITMKVATREMLARYAFYSSASHTRSIPNRGPCFIVPRSGRPEPAMGKALLLLAVRDRWEDVWRSMVQLVLGSFMVWHARQLGLCRRYFDAESMVERGAASATR